MGRKKYRKELKTQIALDAIKGHNSTAWVLSTAFQKISIKVSKSLSLLISAITSCEFGGHDFY
jgi:hypothetical protein